MGRRDVPCAFHLLLIVVPLFLPGLPPSYGAQLLPASFTLKQTADFYSRAGLAVYDASIAGWQVRDVAAGGWP
jgi:hypothetical protein